MSDLRNGIQFHTRKILSHSKSRDKFSPYRRQRSKQKYSQSAENRQKIALQEPIIKIRTLIDNNSRNKKLTLNHQPQFEPINTRTTYFSNLLTGNYSQKQYDKDRLTELGVKIDNQSQMIKEKFIEITRKLQMPRAKQMQEQLDNNRRVKAFQENQQKIMQYLESLSEITKENQHLRALLQKYQEELFVLKAEIDEKNRIQLGLLQKISMLKIGALVKLEEDYFNREKLSQKHTTEKSMRQESIQNLFKAFQTQNAKVAKDNASSEHIIEQRQKQIRELKLQNQILSEEVKLLNFTIQEKEEHISMLSKLTIPKVKTNSSIDPLMSLNSKIGLQESLSSAGEVLANSSLINKSIKTKKTNSFIVLDKDIEARISKIVSNRVEKQPFQKRQSRRKTSLPRLRSNDNNIQGPNGRKTLVSGRLSIRRETSQVDRKKIDMGRSLLRLKTKGSMMTMNSGKKKSNQKYWNMDSITFKQLQLMRKTIGYRLKGFRYKKSYIEQGIFDTNNQEISSFQIKDYLSEYPFLLSQSLIQAFMSYLFNYEQKNNQTVTIDLFWNKLRELIPTYELLDQQIDAISMQKIKKLLANHQGELLALLRQSEKNPEVVSAQAMKAILRQFKVGEPEIQLIISQCCIISSDCDHLHYQQFFDLYKEKEF